MVSLHDNFSVPVHFISYFSQAIIFVENRKYMVHPNTALNYSPGPLHTGILETNLKPW